MDLWDHIAIIGTKKQHGHDQSTILSILSIGAGLLPVGPHKLVNRSQSGEFLDMAELLPDHLGVSTNPQNTGGGQATSKEQEVSSGIYTGVRPMLWHIHHRYSGKAPRHRHVICYHFSTQFISYLDGIVLCLIPRHHLARILLPVCTPPNIWRILSNCLTGNLNDVN